MKSIKRRIAGWGNYPKQRSTVFIPSDQSDIQKVIDTVHPITPRGNGRSYGDASLGDFVVDLLKHSGIAQIDSQNGFITCRSGTLIRDVLNVVITFGWFLDVIPGTQFVSIGGAIAADIHGKNHLHSGSFVNVTHSIKLLDPNNNVIELSRESNADLFYATIGGMGLTGIILEATLKLRRIDTSYMTQKTSISNSLSETLDMLGAAKDSPYTVTWIDTRRPMKKFGRGVLFEGDHASKDELGKSSKKGLDFDSGRRKFNVPFLFPSFALNGISMRMYNDRYFRKWKDRSASEVLHLEPFFFPLDSMLNWNRIYGRRGFIQYQCVIPEINSKAGIYSILNEVKKNRKFPYLTVLKQMGEANETSPLSFPMKGFSIAMDFKMRRSLLPFLERLDDIVLELGGRIYLAKDARMSSEMLFKFYPKAEEFLEKYCSEKFGSKLATRLGLFR